jgi:hypothetical protein
VSYVLWVVALVLDHGVLGPHLSGVHRRSQALETQGVADSTELQTLANDPRAAVTGMVLLVILVVFLGLMVFRPE